VLNQYMLVPQLHSNRRSAVSAETRVLCQRFEVKNQRGLCEVCGEEPEACVRFVVKNPTGLCEVCGEEPEACVRFVVKNQRPA